MTRHWIDHSHARPRYRTHCPVLWRSDDLAQIGEGRRHVITPLDQPLAAWLISLTGLRSVGQLLLDLPDRGLDPDRAMALLKLAADAGAIDDASQLPMSWRYLDSASRVQSEPDHTAALLTFGHSHIADQLIDHRHRTLAYLTAPAAQRPNPHLAFAVEQAVSAAGLTFTQNPTSADLTIILGSHPVIGSEVAAVEVPLPTSAHLFVASYGDRAVAGPLVVPGTTSCLRCAYLHTRDADQQWPHVSLQLQHAISTMKNPPVDRLLTTMIAAHAGQLVRAWVDHTVTQSRWKNISYELRLPECEVLVEPRPPHPLCQCQWTLEADLAPE